MPDPKRHGGTRWRWHLRPTVTGAAMRFIALILALLISPAYAQVPMTGAGLGAPASGAHFTATVGPNENLSACTTCSGTQNIVCPASSINVVAGITGGITTLALADTAGSTYTLRTGTTSANAFLFTAPVSSAQTTNKLTFTLGTSTTIDYEVLCVGGSTFGSPIDTTADADTGASPAWTTTASPTALIGVTLPNSGQYTGISGSPGIWQIISPSGYFSALVYNLNGCPSTCSGVSPTLSGSTTGGSVVSAIK